MIDFQIFLSNNKTQLRFVLQNVTDVLALFGGLMSSIMGLFAVVSQKANYKMLLAKQLEILYLVDNNEMKSTKISIRRKSAGIDGTKISKEDLLY